MIYSIFLGIYFLFCLMVAFVGRKVNIGFWGILIMSVLVTPLVTAILIVILRPKRRKIRWEDLEG